MLPCGRLYILSFNIREHDVKDITYEIQNLKNIKKKGILNDAR